MTPPGLAHRFWHGGSWPYIAPFGTFVVLMAILRLLRLSDLATQVVLISATGLVVVAFARPALDLRVHRWGESVLVGLLVFLIWIGPDLLFPGYRADWLFHNSLVGSANSSLSVATRADDAVLSLRALRAVLLVPVIEELFWRAWLMRWVIRADFQTIALGTYSWRAFWLVAVLFASEHGPYWDVGLAAGLLYNWWMIRTRSLGNLILTHAVTNACLSAYVIVAGRWEYWL